MEISKVRDWFKQAVDHGSEWRKLAREEYDFVRGKQWSEDDKAALTEKGRPALTINKIRPHLNILSGYQRVNRYEVNFEPRTSDDFESCELRKGVTKYIMDNCDYNDVESAVFMDGIIGGIGWFHVFYDWDYTAMEGEIDIERISPFDIYTDPEARKPDYSDGKFLCRAKWVDKDELCDIYPEHADDILSEFRRYDMDEKEADMVGTEPLWYNRDLKKVRLIECWYKEREMETRYMMADGTISDVPPPIPTVIASPFQVPVDKVRLAVIMGDIKLEEMDSPYQHGFFPFVPFTLYHYGEGDVPCGVVRDVKDPQREINKKRSQILHILNTQGNSGLITETTAMTEEQQERYRKYGSKPGAIIEVNDGTLAGGRIREIQPSAPPVGLIQSAQESEADIPKITGINESMLGISSPQQSGRAIELNQRQAVTNIAPFFDNLRKSKRAIVQQLWGYKGHKGLIPQYYTEEKVFRIVGKTGQEQFVTVNQQVQMQDPQTGQLITTVLNDLSQGNYDVIISDTPYSVSQRQGQFWALVDAVSKLGLPANIIFDKLIELSDIPDKQEIIQRLQSQQQQANAPKEPNVRRSMSINLDDVIKLQQAARDNLVPPEIAQGILQQYAGQFGLQIPQGQVPPPQSPQPEPMTQAAAQALMAGSTPPGY
ncbi:hypothetical protein HMPREF3191_00880 [Veillonellaceae bacterium DNF00626]|nr:hypothetical protein HMPREF3191_00880 [Veillonellaceae bacterium DNF00626]